MESERTTSLPLDGLSSGGQRSRSIHGRTTGPTRRSTKGQWTVEEDEILSKAVERFKGKNWKKIAECFKDRTDVQCLHRWQKVLNPELVKGPWTKEEDAMIVDMVKKYGPKKWSTIAQHLQGRIGKQCRERWHNHLNPAINKEAWTQEEELALIRAHQIYGNKWAELTKFLSGRTDNAIKNHWHSSVKKKLESYIASGLIAQFPALPPNGYQNQDFSSTSRLQSSGEETGLKGETEAEEISDFSQGSAILGCSQSSDDVFVQKIEDHRLLETSNFGIQRMSSSLSCPDRYFSTIGNLEAAALSIPQTGCSSDLPVHFSHVDDAGREPNCQINSDDLPDISVLELAQGSSGFPQQGTDFRNGMEQALFRSYMEQFISQPAGALGVATGQLNHTLISDEECCRILFSDTFSCGFSSQNPIKEDDKFDISGTSNIPVAKSSRVLQQQPYDRLRLEGLEESFGQPYMSAPLFYSNEEEENSVETTTDLSGAASKEDAVRCELDSFTYTNNDDDRTGTVEPFDDLPTEQSKIVPVNTSCSTSNSLLTCDLEEQNLKREKRESSSLCYEPPRFPTLDIPFLSCDLLQSCTESHMDYSPLGIRKLMMSSMGCISPLRLWDSPSHHDSNSPEGLLRSVAKTFTNTPSILRKRNRDLLSPLSDRRMDKRKEKDIAANLSRDFSRLDVVVDETAKVGTRFLVPNSSENRNSVSLADKDIVSKTCEREYGNGDAKASSCDDGFKDREDQGADVGNAKLKHKLRNDSNFQSMQVQQSPGILSEHDLNDFLLSSPTQPNPKNDKASRVAASYPARSYPPGSSPATCRVRYSSAQKKLASGSRLLLHTSSPLEIVVGKGVNDTGAESSLSITPFKRSIDSPSAWKSPWFMNSFVPGPRVETDITIEDIGYFLSPGDRSYDAIGLRKHLSEHNEAAYTSAEETLGMNTPEPIKKRCSDDDGNEDQENLKPNQSSGYTSNLSSNILIERRALDFSECGSPGKAKEKEGSSRNFVSPSSYLLKRCR